MHRIVKLCAATALVAGGLLGAAVPVMAGADDGGVNAFWREQAPQPAQPSTAPAPRSSSRGNEYRAIYAAPAQQQPAAPSSTPDKDPPYFNHAMGTMGQP